MRNIKRNRTIFHCLSLTILFLSPLNYSEASGGKMKTDEVKKLDAPKLKEIVTLISMKKLSKKEIIELIGLATSSIKDQKVNIKPNFINIKSAWFLNRESNVIMIGLEGIGELTVAALSKSMGKYIASEPLSDSGDVGAMFLFKTKISECRIILSGANGTNLAKSDVKDLVIRCDYSY